MGILLKPGQMAYKDPQTGEYKEISVVGGKTSIIQTISTYQASTSGTIIPTGEWLDNVPAVPQAHYLWSRIELRLNTGQTTMLYTCARQGLDGSGSVSSVNDVSPDSSGNVALPIDAAPTAGSTNPVTSGGAYTALDGKVNKAGDTITGEINLTRENGFPSIKFHRFTDPYNGPQQMIQTNETGTYSYMTFYQRINEDSAWEGFRLPTTTEALTSGNANYGILTTKPGTGSLYYAPGETYSTSATMMISGYITNGVRNIHLGLWLPKSLERINRISITNLVGSMRGINGYINNWTGDTNILTQPGITIEAHRTTPNGICLNIGKSSDYTNATANTPVSLSGRITLSFS